MPVDYEDILEACEALAKIEGLKVTVEAAAKGAAITGGAALASAFVGGLLFGRKGLALGGLVGGTVGCAMSDDFKPLYQVIQELPEEEKMRLVSHMRKIVNKLDISDAAVLMAVVHNPGAVGRDTLVKSLGSYFNVA